MRRRLGLVDRKEMLKLRNDVVNDEMTSLLCYENVSVVLRRVGNWVQGTPLNSFSSCLTVFRLLEYQSN